MTWSDVLPVLASSDIRDARRIDAEVSGDSCLRFSGCQPRANGNNALSSQFSLRVIVAFSRPSTSNHVPHVIRVGTKGQVIRENAQRDITTVPNDHTGRDGAVVNLVTNAVCVDSVICFPASHTAVEHSIAVGNFGTGPQPTAARLVNSRPEARHQSVLGSLSRDVAGMGTVRKSFGLTRPGERLRAICTLISSHVSTPTSHEYVGNQYTTPEVRRVEL